MESVNLSAKARDVFGKKTKKSREEGLIPAVIYGRGIETKSLWVKDLDFGKLVKSAGESTMINLNIDKKEKDNVIIYELQTDPVTGKYIHIDFFKVRMDEEVKTEVELVFVGESPAVKESGGILVKNMDKITVRCLPADLPSKIEVNIAILKNFDDHITIKDLNLSDKLKIDIAPGTVVALVTPPRSEEELEDLSSKVEEDVTKVEGVVKEEPTAETPESETNKSNKLEKEAKKE